MNALAIKVSEHGKDRFIERVSLQDQAEIFYMWLYMFGREPSAEEFAEFECRKLPGREYRVCWHKSRCYLVVYDADNKTFVTLWKR